MFGIFIVIILLNSHVLCKNANQYFDSFRGVPVDEEAYKQSVTRNTTFWCVNEIARCNPHEGRRVDGSCNNLKHPTRGATHTPFYRLLPAVYDDEFEPRRSQDGGPLPLVRRLRTNLMAEGRVPDQVFTQLVTHFLTFVVGDIVSLQDTVNYILWKPYCCQPKGKQDRACVPISVPDDDPVHRFSNVRCLNLTRPETFQSVGCIKNGTVPERIVSSTPLFDLSNLYGNLQESLDKRGRNFARGLLKYEIEEGRIWPPSTKTKVDLCLLNQKPIEKRCHNTPEDGINSLLGINLFAIWFWRYHNHIADALARINPCWSDDKLFDTARDINIAVYTQILYYELLPKLMGKDNLLRDSILSSSPGFRDIYNEQILPQVALEFPHVLRWFHTMQEGALKMYDHKGHYLKQFPIVNLTLRTGYLAMDNNIDYITQGSFRQASAKIDYVVDPDVAEIGLGPHQRASDLLTSDLAKNRLFGFQPYVKYREFCFGRPYDKFDDLKDAFDPERLELIKEQYKHIKDIDLMAGIWLEKLTNGGFLPQTLHCLMSEQFVHNVVSDRHWYERSSRPHSFTLEQLMEIRKSSISRLLCDVGDTVTRIQPSGFLRAGPGNEIGRCEELPNINFEVWGDLSCTGGRYRHTKRYN